MHFPKLLSYLSVLFVGIISTVGEAHARPFVRRDDGDDNSRKLNSDLGALLNATFSVTGMLLELIQLQLLSNTSTPDISDALTPDFELFSIDNVTANLPFSQLENCVPSFPFDDSQSFSELLVYITGAVSAGVTGYTVEIFDNFTLSTSVASSLLNMPPTLSVLQAFANELLFGPTDLIQGFSPPLFTPLETLRALTVFSGNCSLDSLDPADQSSTFSSIPPVVFASNSSQMSEFPPFIIPVNTTLDIDTTLLRDSDNCKPDAPGLSCQIMALQDVQSFQPVSVAVLPLSECRVTVPGVNNVYITSDNTPLPTDPADRVNMPTDAICAGPMYVYVHEPVALQV